MLIQFCFQVMCTASQRSRWIMQLSPFSAYFPTYFETFELGWTFLHGNAYLENFLNFCPNFCEKSDKILKKSQNFLENFQKIACVRWFFYYLIIKVISFWRFLPPPEPLTNAYFENFLNFSQIFAKNSKKFFEILKKIAKFL